jgi:hypothetical protein
MFDRGKKSYIMNSTWVKNDLLKDNKLGEEILTREER